VGEVSAPDGAPLGCLCRFQTTRGVGSRTLRLQRVCERLREGNTIARETVCTGWVATLVMSSLLPTSLTFPSR
jgi:hypothetical protein